MDVDKAVCCDHEGNRAKKHPPRFSVGDVAQMVMKGPWTIPKLYRAKLALDKSAYPSADILSANISCVLEVHENYAMGKEDSKWVAASKSERIRRQIKKM